MNKHGSTAKNDVTAPLFLLVKYRLITLDTVLCPSSTQVRDTLGGRPLEERWNFTPWTEQAIQAPGSTLSYSFADQYAYVSKEYRPPPKVVPDFAVAADRNDSHDAFRASLPNATPEIIRAANSWNHAQAGQNVLYNDGHVAWWDTPLCGHNRDNIYDGDAFQGARPADSPAHKNDSVLLPHWPIWFLGH